MAAEATNSASRPDLVRALRAAAFTGLIAFGLFLPLIAFRAVHDIRNELVLETRWPLFAAFVASAFVGRLIWELLPRERLKQQLAEFFRSPLQARRRRPASARWPRPSCGSSPGRVRHRERRSRSPSPTCSASARSRFAIGAAVAWVNVALSGDDRLAAAGAAARSASRCAWSRSASCSPIR